MPSTSVNTLMGRSGASLMLGALVTLAGPLDLLAHFVRRSSPIIDHALRWRGGFSGLFDEGAGHPKLSLCSSCFDSR